MDKRYLNNIIKFGFTALLSIALIAYIIYHLVAGFSSEVETMAASIVTVSSTSSADGYIFRDETLVPSDSSGMVSYIYNDGTMVRRNSQVANVFTGNETEETKSRISSIESQISILQNSSLAQDVTMTDSKTIDAQIDSLYYSMVNNLHSGNLNYIFRRKFELLTLLNKRQLVLKNVDSFALRITELETEKNQLASSIGGRSSAVYTPVSGYFYSDVDGYEGIFTGEVAQNLTLGDFEKIIDSEPAQSSQHYIGKVATDYEWYLACSVSSVQQQSFIEGKRYTIRFPYSGDDSIPMELSRIVTSSDSDHIVLVFSTGSLPEGFDFLRKQTVEIEQESYTGYRIPLSAIRIIDGEQGVYIKAGNVVKFKKITPLAEIDGYMIVEVQDKVNDEDYASKLGTYDLVITKGKNLHENKIIQ